MSRPNMNNHFTFAGRLSSHPSVFDNKDGSKSVLMHVLTEGRWNSETNSYDLDDVELRGYVPADRVGKSNLLWAVKGSEVRGTARLTSYRKTDENGKIVETTHSVDIYEFKLSDTAAETNARLTRYANEGDQKAAELLAARQNGQSSAQAAPAAAQATQAPAQGSVPAPTLGAQPQASQSAPQAAASNDAYGPFAGLISQMQGGQSAPAAPSDNAWAGQQDSAPDWAGQ